MKRKILIIILYLFALFSFLRESEASDDTWNVWPKIFKRKNEKILSDFSFNYRALEISDIESSIDEIQSGFISYNLLKKHVLVSFEFGSVVAEIKLNDSSRLTLNSCLDKYFRWESIASKDGDLLEKELCRLRIGYLYIDKKNNTRWNKESKEILVKFETDQSGTRIYNFVILFPETEGKNTSYKKASFEKHEAITIRNLLDDSDVKNDIDSHLKKELTIEEKYE